MAIPNKKEAVQKEPMQHNLESLEFPETLDLIAEHTETSCGARLIRELRPGKIQAELETEFSRISDFRAAVERGEPVSFRGIRDVTESLESVSIPGTRLEISQLLDISQTIITSHKVIKQIENHEVHFIHIEDILEELADLSPVAKAIYEKIDPASGQMRNNASRKLKEIRDSMAKAESQSKSTLNRLITTCQSKGWLLDSGYTISDGRLLLAVKDNHRGKIRGIVHGFSSSGATAYIEPDELVELANKRRLLEAQEEAEIAKILLELTDLVRIHAVSLEHLLLSMGYLDSLQARAVYSWNCNSFQPKFNPDCLELVEARHPILLARKGQNGAVSLTLRLDSESRIILITGPNAGGKSVALKTVGLITMMVASGIIPPVGEGTVIPLISSWFAVIGDEQSIHSDLSSFSGHLHQLKSIFDNDDNSKCVLIDEIASGTDPDEGAALSMAILNRLVEMRAWAIVTTHIGALKAFAHKTPGIRNGSMRFDREKLLPTYEFIPDLPGSSYALEIASRVGLPSQVIKEAKKRIGKERERLEDLIDELSHRLKSAEMDSRILSIKKSETSALEKMLEERISQLDAKKSAITSEAVEQAESLIREANRLIEHTVKEIKEKQASHEVIKKAKDTLQSQKKHLEKKSKELQKKKKTVKQKENIPEESGNLQLADIHPGMMIQLKNGVRGQVSTVQGDRIQLLTGAIKVWIHLADISGINKDQSPKTDVRLAFQRSSEESSVRIEFDLRGLRYEEAEAALEKYLADLIASGLPHARIVHGKGTGTLRAMVLEKVRDHPGIMNYRLGEAGEGGDGVTIIEVAK